MNRQSIICGRAEELMHLFPRSHVVVTDPPYNVGYHYNEYHDSLPDDEYYELLSICCRPPSVVIAYPEIIFRFALFCGIDATEHVSWVYHANTPRQWRLISWFGCAPDWGRVSQPYRNLSDRRIQKLMQRGQGARLSDWWECEQVKNVSDEKTAHPCQIPISIMSKIIRLTDGVILDPFAGSGSTLAACRNLDREAIGIERDFTYCRIVQERLSQRILFNDGGEPSHGHQALF